MDGISCDRCGEGLLIEEDVRYRLKVELVAAYDPLEITSADLERDLESEIRATIAALENVNPTRIARDVAFRGEYDLCLKCQREFLADPVFRPIEDQGSDAGSGQDS